MSDEYKFEDDVRYIHKWLNEEQTAPIDRVALAKVLHQLAAMTKERDDLLAEKSRWIDRANNYLGQACENVSANSMLIAAQVDCAEWRTACEQKTEIMQTHSDERQELQRQVLSLQVDAKQADEFTHMALDERDEYLRQLEAAQADNARLREALEKINKAYDGVSDGIQGDLENGVKWLNQEAARKFNREYPGVVKALDILLDASITADEALALPADHAALDALLAQERERIADAVETGIGHSWSEIAAAIRSLA